MCNWSCGHVARVYQQFAIHHPEHRAELEVRSQAVRYARGRQQLHVAGRHERFRGTMPVEHRAVCVADCHASANGAGFGIGNGALKLRDLGPGRGQ